MNLFPIVCILNELYNCFESFILILKSFENQLILIFTVDLSLNNSL